jgi:hypothetical protein
MLMWNLHVSPNFILNFYAQLLYFQNFLQNFVSKLYIRIFSNVSSKIYSFFSNFIYKYCHMSFIFLQNFYIKLLYLNIFIQVNLF